MSGQPIITGQFYRVSKQANRIKGKLEHEYAQIYNEKELTITNSKNSKGKRRKIVWIGLTHSGPDRVQY